MTVVAVSEPGTEGVFTGDLASGFSYTPSTDPALIGSDHQLHYLVTDPDGHVAQSNIQVRILAAGDPNQPPVARDDVARVDAGGLVDSFVVGNDFDPDGDSFSIVKILTPAHGTVASTSPAPFDYSPNAGFSGIETITYTLRDTHGLLSTGLLTVWVDSGVSGAQTPVLGTRLHVRLPGFVGVADHRRVVVQRPRPARPDR